MNYRKKIFILIITLLIISGLSYLYALYIIGCNHSSSYSCSTIFFKQLNSTFVATPLFISASLLFLVIFSEKVFNIWKKYAVVAIPLMLVGIFVTKVDPVACGILICTDRTFMIFFLGIVYTILSVLVTIISALYYKTKK